MAPDSSGADEACLTQRRTLGQWHWVRWNCWSGSLAWTRLATGLIAECDIDEVAWLVDDDTDVLAVLLEHRWVNELAGRVAASSGTVMALTRSSPASIRRPGTGRIFWRGRMSW